MVASHPVASHGASHPAAEIVAITLRKLLKLANRKQHGTLMAESQALLDSLPQLLPPEGVELAWAEEPASASGVGESAPAALAAEDAGHVPQPTPPATGYAEPAAETPEPASSLAAIAVAPPEPELTHAEQAPASTVLKSTVLAALPDLITRTETALSHAVCERIISVMRLATATMRPNIMEPALDCIQKLIAFRFLQGSVYAVSIAGAEDGGKAGQDKLVVSADDPNTRTCQAQAVELMLQCVEVPDENLELMVLKSLLTTATSSTFSLHGQALLLVVRNCYHMFLMSRSDVNQTTAKAALTQMINVVFQRMEADDVLVEVRPIVLADVLGLNRSAGPQDPASAMVANVQAFLNNVLMLAGPAPTSDDIRSSSVGAFAMDHPSDQHGHELSSSQQQSEPHKPSLHHSIPSESDVLSGADCVSVVHPVGTHGHTTLVLQQVHQTPEQQARSRVLQKDASLVFRGLCKLSIQSTDHATTQDPTGSRGKLVALEMLKLVLENSGPMFRRSETFIDAIRQYLCLSLLKNSSSSVPAALQLSCSIFLSLLSKFRTSLKAEVGVFFPMILLKPFEPQAGAPGTTPLAAGTAPAPSPSQAPTLLQLQFKATILRVLGEICRDGQLLVDLFVNYDCDLESSNLFERMVNGLVRLAQQPPVAPPPSPLIADTNNTHHTELMLRHEALQSLVNLVEAMSHWYTLTEGFMEVNLVSAPAPTGEGANGAAEGAEQGSLDAGEESTSSGMQVIESGAGGDEGLNAKRAYKAKFQEGVMLFNRKPKKGIAFLQTEGMLGTDCEDVSTFLAKTKDLDKTLIGDYLGERDDFNLKVMHAYVDQLDFHTIEFDAAIRLFLSGFRLPGEAQKIDRLMEKFAERFVKCNPGSFKSADVAYVLAYSTIMLNTDLHNPQVKVKMSKEGFLKNNRGINDGQDLPPVLLYSLYDRILTDEIKMKEDGNMLNLAQDDGGQNRNMLSTLLTIMGAFRQEQRPEQSEDSLKRTLENLREKARGSIAITVTECAAVRPMMEVTWAPLLGALSMVFDEYNEGRQVVMCLRGISASCCLTAMAGMPALRDIFINSLCNSTHLYSPQTMRLKNALAFQYLLRVAETVGDHLQDRWVEVLRCISRWELLQQIASGTPTDAVLFSHLAERGVKAVLRRVGVFRDDSVSDNAGGGRSMDSLGMSEATIKKLHIGGTGTGHAFGKRNGEEHQVPLEIINSIDANQLQVVFLQSHKLSSEAVVAFVRALCAISRDELESMKTPRIFSMARLVEVAHFNMTRIRLVWSRIWAVLSDYFIQVGCHPNLQVAMYAVDSLRQLAMKFLERDELANYTFQNDFLRPFVVVMRQSQAVEIRELIIRCLSQMVLARVNNVKSGWKSMFMVFTTAAGDKEPMIVNLAFDTIEKIVREHFGHITETETTTFTDCVNCLIAFTNNPHSPTVALNSIAFLRFCADKLAEGAIGDVNALPEGVNARAHQPLRVVALDAVPESLSYTQLQDLDDKQSTLVSPRKSYVVSREAAAAAVEANANIAAEAASAVVTAHRKTAVHAAPASGLERGGSTRTSTNLDRSLSGRGPVMRFVDRDEHVYFWFPLLAGLSELTFDPRDVIRNSALEVLFEVLKSHGSSFAASFWRRVFDSVLMPIFDHVRAEVTDTTTFTSERRREKEDAWLYETCKRCLQHLVDVFVQFYPETQGLLPQLLQLLSSFVIRSHQSLAAGGVYAITHLTNSAATQLSPEAWQSITSFLLSSAQDSAPNAAELVTPPTRVGTSPAHAHAQPPSPPSAQGPGDVSPRSSSLTTTTPPTGLSGSAPLGSSGQSGAQGSSNFGPTQGYSLREGMGARRLAKFRSQAAVHVLLVQACSDIYSRQHHLMPTGAMDQLLEALEFMAYHASKTDMDVAVRLRLAMQQAEDRVPDDRLVCDPPLLVQETSTAHAYLTVLMHLTQFSKDAEMLHKVRALDRLVRLCLDILARFCLGSSGRGVQPDSAYITEARARQAQLATVAAVQVVEAAGGLRGSGFLGAGTATRTEAQRKQGATLAAGVAAAVQGLTPDRKSLVVGRTSAGARVVMAAPSTEYAGFTSLIRSTLAALSSFDDATFRTHLHSFFPLLTVVISTEYTPAEVLRVLADLFAKRVGPILGVSQAEVAAGMAAVAASARSQAEALAKEVGAGSGVEQLNQGQAQQQAVALHGS